VPDPRMKEVPAGDVATIFLALSSTPMTTAPAGGVLDLAVSVELVPTGIGVGGVFGLAPAGAATARSVQKATTVGTAKFWSSRTDLGGDASSTTLSSDRSGGTIAAPSRRKAFAKGFVRPPDDHQVTPK
jgi:hypothetical protein